MSALLPPAGEVRQTLVLVAHHDAAHTGLVWRPWAVAASRSRSRRNGRAIPSHAVPLAALTAMVLPVPAARGAAAAVLGLSGLLVIDSMRSATAPGANDNATGVAAVLELARRLHEEPLANTAVRLVFPGGEEAGNQGMLAWMRSAELAPETTFVINLDALGSGGRLAVSRSEGLTGRHAARDVALAHELAADCGIDLDTVTCPNITDATIARHAGLRTISLLSVEDGWISNLHQRSDTPDNVRFNTVEDAVVLTERIAATWNHAGNRDA